MKPTELFAGAVMVHSSVQPWLIHEDIQWHLMFERGIVALTQPYPLRETVVIHCFSVYLP